MKLLTKAKIMNIFKKCDYFTHLVFKINNIFQTINSFTNILIGT